MPQKVYNQIQYLCQQIAKVEWSGILFYKTEGSIQDPSSFKIILEDILPLHKGTSTYTEYTFDERVIDYMEMEGNEHLEECRIGHIHSHNTMGVFFSGTDWSELEDNAPNHNYYLSLIVNNFMDFCAKVCFIAEAKNETFTFEAKDELGKRYTVSSGDYSVPPRLIVYDCDIDSPKKNIEVNQTFTQKVRSIIEKAEKIMSNTANNTSNSTLVKPGESWLQTQEKKENNWNKELEFQGTLADAIEEFVEEFTMFVINTGNPIEEFTTIEDVCKNYESYNITGPMLAGNVASSYIKAYQNYFGMFGEEIQDPVMFEKATEEVIWELEHVVLTTKNKMVEKMLEPSLEVIKKILSDFLKIEKV
jgi:hypothetical protein